jgi:hypothetical protein
MARVYKFREFCPLTSKSFKGEHAELDNKLIAVHMAPGTFFTGSVEFLRSAVNHVVPEKQCRSLQVRK